MWVCGDDSLPSHLAIWKFIYSVQDSTSATASAWGDLNSYILPAWKLTPPPCIWPGISAVCTACSTWGASKWLAQNLVQKHVPRERGMGICIQTKSLGTVRKEFTENLCSCYRLISQLLVKRGWLQTLWLLGIHRRGKALWSPGFALLCFKLFHAKWSGDIRTSTSILIPEHPVVWEPGALLVCQVSSACARTALRVVQGCSLTSFFTAPLVLPTTFLFIKTTKTKWKCFVVDVKQLHTMSYNEYNTYFFLVVRVQNENQRVLF